MKRLLRLLLVLFLAAGLIACQTEDVANPNEDDQNTTENVANNVETNDGSDEVNQNDNNDNADEVDSATDNAEFVFADVEREADGKIESGKGGYLWKVENGNTTVYLQGTVHLGTPDFYPLHDSIEQAYESADIVVPEVDISEIDLLSSLGATFMHGVYIDGTTIEDHISSEVYEKLKNVLDDYGIPMEVMKFFKPWMINSTITQLIADELDFMHGIDMYFLERAAEDGKEVIELETVQEQYDVLAGRSAEFQEQQLEETLDSLENFESTMMEVFSLYLDGQVQPLLEYLFPEDESEMDPEYRDYLKELNDDRNIKMAEKIAGFLEEDNGKTYFVFVGTAHLIKDPHILSILHEQGYEIEHIY